MHIKEPRCFSDAAFILPIVAFFIVIPASSLRSRFGGEGKAEIQILKQVQNDTKPPPTLSRIKYGSGSWKGGDALLFAESAGRSTMMG